MGCSNNTAASTAVRPRLIPCPSTAILGERYFNFRRRELRMEKPTIPIKNNAKLQQNTKPIKSSGLMPIFSQNEGVMTALAGTYCLGKEAPKE